MHDAKNAEVKQKRQLRTKRLQQCSNEDCDAMVSELLGSTDNVRLPAGSTAGSHECPTYQDFNMRPYSMIQINTNVNEYTYVHCIMQICVSETGTYSSSEKLILARTNKNMC